MGRNQAERIKQLERLAKGLRTELDELRHRQEMDDEQERDVASQLTELRADLDALVEQVGPPDDDDEGPPTPPDVIDAEVLGEE